jgi:plasmid stabilization system protein ParE
LIELTPEALRQLEDLKQHYSDAERLEALSNLEAAIFEAVDRIEHAPHAGLAAPRPYPQITRPGQLWLKAGRYWIAYRLTPKLAITAVFYDMADIPNRI